MCMFVLCTGPVRITPTKLALYCFLLCLIICKCAEESVPDNISQQCKIELYCLNCMLSSYVMFYRYLSPDNV